MRKIPAASTATFAGVTTSLAVLAVAGALEFARATGLHPATVPPVLLGCFLYYFGNLLFLKLFLALFPLPRGVVAERTPANYRHGVYMLFFLFFLAPVIFSRLIPAPFTSLWYRFLGARIGRQSFPSGSVLADPHFITLGDEVTLGFNSVLTPHVMVGESLSHERIVIGDRVTVGVNTVVYGGVEIGDGALVLANSAVVPGTRIGENEMWGGNPAQKIKTLKPGDRAWNGAPQTAPQAWNGEKKLEIARGV